MTFKISVISLVNNILILFLLSHPFLALIIIILLYRILPVTRDVVNDGFVVSSKNKTDSTKDDSNIISIDEMILNDGSDIINNYEQTLLDPNNYSNFDIFNSDEFKNELGFTSPLRYIPPSPPK